MMLFLFLFTVNKWNKTDETQRPLLEVPVALCHFDQFLAARRSDWNDQMSAGLQLLQEFFRERISRRCNDDAVIG